MRILAYCLAPAFTGLTATALAGSSAASSPGSKALLNAELDPGNWILPAKSYSGNRFTALTQIGKTNVGTLSMAWRTNIADDGQQEASPIIWNGTIYLSTPHDGVLALGASNGKLLWQTPYNPKYVLLYAVNRGIGLADGKVVIATQDCRVIALEAATGKSLWNVQGCRDTSNSFYSMAAYVYKNEVILGTGGGDNGTLGPVSAFSIKDGKRLWDWQTIPDPGQPGHETWPGDSWKHGGGAVWSGIAIDPRTDTLFVAPGNPGPDMILAGRKGENLYTDSIVALDISGARPRIKWYYKILRDDTHDDDPAMIPVLFEGQVDGQARSLVAIGEAGNQQTPNLPTSQGSRVIAYRLGGAPTIVNDATGQVALANALNGIGGESQGPPSKSTGSAPYTQQQVADGGEIYTKECAICHGAKLQGLSAPALTGPGFGRSHLNASQVRDVVTQSMPLTAPGSLKPDQYAAVTAFLLSYDCVQPSSGGQEPFPTTDLASLRRVELGSATCAAKK